MSMTEFSPAEVEQVFSNALQMHQTGNLEQAERLYEQVVATDPRHFDGFNLLGLIALQTDRNELAVERFSRAMAVSDKVADVHNNLGEAYRRLDRMEEAIRHFEKAAALDPALLEARMNAATIARMLGQVDSAAAHLEAIAAQNPQFPRALRSLGEIRLAQGRGDEALLIAQRVLQFDDSSDAKSLFVDSFRIARSVPPDPALRKLIVRALSEPWTRPSALGGIATLVATSNSAIRNVIARMKAPQQGQMSTDDLFGSFGLSLIAGDELLLCLLETIPACDPDLERLLTLMRFMLLQTAASAPDYVPDPALLRFQATLARHCYLNDYVFFCSDAERDMLAQLRTMLSTALARQSPVPPLLPVAIGAYVSLHTIPGAEALLQQPFPAPVVALLTQQIREPLEERRLRAGLNRLTPIDDAVSMRVQQQYEENPYPTWVKDEPIWRPTNFADAMRRRFPLVDYHPINNPNPDILIAGCGTGQHPIQTARAYPDARVLAIDLSSSSLAYAQRKTNEAGVANLNYAQADILKLGSLTQRFDAIESSGVLHHLEDPRAGLRVLISLLRPNGFLRLGFYSHYARDHVRAVRDYIASGGYDSTPDGIRKCRQQILKSPDNPAFAWVAQSFDFYSTSACRDLLFHVQEHQMTLPQIKDILAEEKLTFLGFENLPTRVSMDYFKQFPSDKTLNNLDTWHQFEEQHPHLFGGMYQFWVQKAD